LLKYACRYFLHGVCKFGEDCRYSHDTKDPSDMVCRYYQAGQCTYGDKCRYGACKKTFFLLFLNVFIPVTNVLNAGSLVCVKNFTKTKQISIFLVHSGSSKILSQTSTEADWANAVEFIPGKQYSPRCKFKCSNTYSSALKEGLQLSTSPNKYDDLCPFALNGECVNGDNCAYVHGLMCDMCGLFILHPTDVLQQEKHKEECIKYHEEDMVESFKVAQSRELSCGICMEVVWEKTDEKDRKFGILENCNHTFCLDCIRKWRSAKAFNNTVVKACPQCRVSSSFVTPSEQWIQDEDEKKKLIQGYKAHLSNKACKYFDQGRGKCPFGANCFYLHAYSDGRKQDRSKITTRRVVDSTGT
uniref:RING-type E3 ubiquitin transferase n=1 Tax=Ciona savignyi TaxID=51511 RepID=H2YZX8_CIOSA